MIIRRIKHWFFSTYRNKNVQRLRALGVKIGEDCEIYPSASFGSEPYLISLGNHVRINEGVHFITHDGGMWVIRRKYDDFKDADLFGRIVIKDNVHIGHNVIVMPGVTIGENSVVGCGAIVTKSVPANSIVVGVPARIIETTDEYFKKNENKIVHTKKLRSNEKKEYLCGLPEDAFLKK